MTTPLPDLEDRIYTFLMQAAGDEPETIAAKLNVTIPQIQSVCGDRIGHEWTRWEGGDGALFMQSSEFCFICGLAREYDDE